MALFNVAASRVPEICDHWSLPIAKLNPFPHPRLVAHTFSSGGGHFGYYRENEIWVNVEDSSWPVKVQGRAWSYPGNKTDRTASGILFHELGHHMVANTKMNPEQWRAIVDKFKSEAVSGYEPNYEESFAETARVFSSNPDLLRLACPNRYQYFTQYFTPWHQTPWRDVLEFAPDFIISNAARWAKEIK